MAVYHDTRPAPMGAAFIYRVANRIEALFALFEQWNTARRTEKALASLSDHELMDIGLHRGDIPTVAGTLSRKV